MPPRTIRQSLKVKFKGGKDQGRAGKVKKKTQDRGEENKETIGKRPEGVK